MAINSLQQNIGLGFEDLLTICQTADFCDVAHLHQVLIVFFCCIFVPQLKTKLLLPTLPVVFYQLFTYPLDGFHSQLGAIISVEGRWRPSLVNDIHLLTFCFFRANEDHNAAAYLLKMSQHVDPTVKNTLPFGGIQLVEEIRSVVLMAFFIPVKYDQVI